MIYPEELSEKVGLSLVFVESCLMGLGKLTSARIEGGYLYATFESAKSSFACKRRFWQEPGDDPIEKILDDPPFGETWSIAMPADGVYTDEGVWEVTSTWGGGSRLFFDEEFVERFARGDVSWLDEYDD